MHLCCMLSVISAQHGSSLSAGLMDITITIDSIVTEVFNTNNSSYVLIFNKHINECKNEWTSVRNDAKANSKLQYKKHKINVQ